METAFMVQGLLTARQWLADKDSDLAARCDRLWQDVEWDWYTRGTDSLYWHWSKNYGWKMNHRIKGFERVTLGPGESKEVSFSIDAGTISFWRQDMTWGPESGDFMLFIGGSSDNVKEIPFSYAE